MSAFIVSPLHIPESLDAADASDFIAASVLVNRVIESILGSSDFALEPAERLPLANQPDWIHHYFIAKVDDEVVGWTVCAGIRSAEAKECWMELYVDEHHRRIGVGSALLDSIIEAARVDGRTDLYVRAFTRFDPSGEQIAAASGFGSLPVNDNAPAFSRVRGFALEQVGQINRLAMPVAAAVLDERVSAAREGYGDDYELVSWSGSTPEQYLDGMASLLTAMSTEEPHADLEVTEDVWDADRVRQADEREAESPRIKLTAAAISRASDELVAFTNLDVPPEPDRPVNQWATLVLPEHRGKRLGLAVKLENIRQLADEFPGHPSITTINAVENAYMIDVNRSVGFTTVGQGGIFRRAIGTDQ